MSRDLVLEIKSQNKDLKQKLAESKRELAEFKRAVKEANSGMGQGAGGGSLFDGILKKIAGNGNSASNALGLMGGGLTKLAGFLGVAVGAAEMFNTTISSSNSLGDEFEKIQTQAGMAVNYFGNSLANVDFSNFWQGLQNAISGAGRLADILDRVNSELQGLGVRTAERQLKIAELEGQAAQLARSDPNRQKIYDQIKKLQEEGIKETKALAADMRQGAITNVAAAAGLSDKEQVAYTPEIEDLIRNKTDAQIKKIVAAYNEWKSAKNAAMGAAVGSGSAAGGMFRTNDLVEYNKRIRESENEVKKLGSSLRQAQILSRIADVSDNAEDAPLTKSRKQYASALNMQTQAQTQLNNLTSRETMLRERMGKAEASRHKAALAAAKKTYVENANTEFQLKANITALTELRDKTVPLSAAWKAYNDEIVETQRKIDRINLQKLDGNTFASLKAQLQQFNSELDNAVIGSQKFNEIRNSVKDVSKAIQQANFDTTDWTDNTQEGLEKQKAALQELLKTFEPTMTEAIKSVNDQIALIDKQLESFNPQPVEGSIDAINKQIQDLEKEANATGSKERRIKLTAQIARLEYDRDLMQQSGNPKLNFTPSFSQVQKAGAYDQASSAAQSVMQNYEIGVIGYEDAKAKIEELNQELIKLGLEPIEIHVVSKGVQKAAKTMQNLGDVMSSVSDSFSSLGQIAEDPALDVAGIIAGAIANVMLGYAQASAQAGTMGPWAWIGFAVAGLATALSAVASIKSATEGYAGGGIVGGASPTGDRLYARVNSGEMILNGSQQANLFKAIDEGRLGADSGAGEVSFVLRGSDLYGSLKNYSHMRARAGKTISF